MKGIEGSDFINANYIKVNNLKQKTDNKIFNSKYSKGPDGFHKYIASQGEYLRFINFIKRNINNL